MPKIVSTEQREMNRFSDFVRGELIRQRKRQTDLAAYMYVSKQTICYKMRSGSWTGRDVVQVLQFLGKEYSFGKEVQR